jgi:hypothetical protein
MRRKCVFFIFSVAIFFVSALMGSAFDIPVININHYNNPDTLDNQILYSGKLWRNLYVRVKGNQFLLTEDFMPGTITIGSRTFKNVSIKYDIYDDELIAMADDGHTIKVNKEIVDSFSFNYRDRTYKFLKIDPDTLKNPSGYVNVLAEGNVSLFVKYKKRIQLLAVDNQYDLFDQFHRIYLMKDGEAHQVNSRKELLELLNDHKQELRNLIKGRRLKVSRNNPDSFMTVVDYYNMLEKK